jgi:two-component system heavy metal sensor histidine kinase CusS
VGNLIENSLAYTPRGGRITIAVAEIASAIRITVSDTGCGIPAEHQSHLFDTLHRVDRARSTTSGGAGLGLAIVKKIMTLHGGTVEITSAPRAGTTVELTFPHRATSAEQETGKTDERVALAPAAVLAKAH